MGDSEAGFVGLDPRVALADWANKQDEWVRRIVRLVLSSGRQLTRTDIDTVYHLFLEEKQLLERSLPPELEISVSDDLVERETPVTLSRISQVSGVNALVTGSAIDFNEGLTILFGENGTGKTGYARVLKCLADSRSVDEILPDVYNLDSPPKPCAEIAYVAGDDEQLLHWEGEQGRAPFTRMSVFDSPAVDLHVDGDLAYVYTPAALALFNHVTHGVQGVQQAIRDEIKTLKPTGSNLLARFDRRSSIYPMIETIGAAADLAELQDLSVVPDNATDQIDELELTVAALRADTLGQQITLQNQVRRVLIEARLFATAVHQFPVDEYNEGLRRLSLLRAEYSAFREALFVAADLPAPPDPTWESFIHAGQNYRTYLETHEVYDQARCLYCRQTLGHGASELVKKYSDYLEDRIADDIRSQEASISGLAKSVLSLSISEVRSFVEQASSDDGSRVTDLGDLIRVLRDLVNGRDVLLVALQDRQALEVDLIQVIGRHNSYLESQRIEVETRLDDLRQQAEDRDQALAEKELELVELRARLELGRAWAEIERRVTNARRGDRLDILGKKIPGVLRQITELAKSASDRLINRNFEQLFNDECEALRTPQLGLEFLGRRGKAQRRKVTSGSHRPSKVLSEGEQKVIALADFLAEARLTGITAPIIFDDPVCSLDHRRVREVADRVAGLASEYQVVVFTHDILFATSLLAHFERSNRCSYYEVTDEEGKGKVTHATGPRWDTISGLRKKVNNTITAARNQEGETRTALVRTAYNWIRSWCEVFVEREVLAEVTQRYQPNVRMTALRNIKVSALGETIDVVLAIFDDACRYTDSHSQPLATLGINPSLQQLEEDWATLQECRNQYLRTAD